MSAIAEHNEAHLLAMPTGDPWLLAWIMLFLAAALRNEDPDMAQQYLDDAAPAIEAMGDVSTQGFLAETRAYLALRRGDTTSAAGELGKALRFTVDIGSPADQVEVLMTVALLLSMRGDPRAVPLVVVVEEKADELGFAMEGRTREIASEVLTGRNDTSQRSKLDETSMDEILDLALQALAEATTSDSYSGG